MYLSAGSGVPRAWSELDVSLTTQLQDSFSKQNRVAASRLLIQIDPYFALSPNSHAEIIWKMFVDIARALAETMQTVELFEQSSVTAQGLTLFCLLVQV